MYDKLYGNIGEKIMVTAVILSWIEFISLIITAFAFFINGSSLGMIFLLGSPLAFVLSWPLYGFGQAIDTLDNINQTLADQSSKTASHKTASSKAPAPKPMYQMPSQPSALTDEDINKLFYFIEESRQCRLYSEIKQLWDSSFNHSAKYLHKISEAISSKVLQEKAHGEPTPSDIDGFCDTIERLVSELIENREQ